jgi:hypothetical protein
MIKSADELELELDRAETVVPRELAVDQVPPAAPKFPSRVGSTRIAHSFLHATVW